MARGVSLSSPEGLVSKVSLPEQKGNWWSGRKEDVIGLNKFEPWQRDIMQLLGKVGTQNLQNPYEGFEPIKKNALSTFFEEIVPQLQEQFSASGSNSASSGTIKSQLSGAGSSLAERLAAFQAHFGQQNQQTGLQQLGLALNPQTDFIHRNAGGGFLNNALDLAKAGATGGGYALGKYLFPV